MESIKIKGLALLLLLVVCTTTQAQTFAEWFSQGKTQIKYLTQQIAALEAFESSMRQGYNMLHSEWTAIGNFKNGEFGLHRSYYTSLSQVNPVVKNSTDLTGIQSEQQSIISQFYSISNLNGLTADEQSYVSLVAQNLMNTCNSDLDELQKVLTAGQLKMSDDERIKRINQLAEAIKDKYLFTCHFTAQVKMLALQRAQENDQLQTERGLYGVH
ncbi:hypothetical protein [Mucilaginibacter sp.]|uniref:hypothetical protein n=1 Tax=Mucilaginibacter sp. TaxID=1882438 RepID=UPI002624F6F4|nr:hypothetical protein [Mucilaginibacter sp.]MDB4925516.1 hypothetical protein [Mucilaginibacter sp.]